MKLHTDKARFKDAIIATSEMLGIEPALVEKDYFVTLFLKKATEEVPGLIFKGGTSLSKCHKLIDRFSEDVDLTLDNEHFSQSKKRNSIKILINICDELGLKLLNREIIKLHTHSNYNCYKIEYPMIFSSYNIKSKLIVEMVYIQKSYPSELKTANSYIGEYITKRGNNDIVSLYELEPFNVQVQSLERTLVDKVFAICDYFLNGRIDRNSRHIYDIYKLLTKIDLYDDDLKVLVYNVRNDRKKNKSCLSAQDNVDIQKILIQIINTAFFKKDYNDVTLKLLIKPLSYDEVISSLESIVESAIFETKAKVSL